MAAITFTIPDNYIGTILDAYYELFGPVLDAEGEPVAEPTTAQKATLAKASLKTQMVGVIKESVRRAQATSTAAAVTAVDDDAATITVT